MINAHAIDRGPAGVIVPAGRLVGTVDSAGYREVDSSARAMARDIEIASSREMMKLLEGEGDGYAADLRAKTALMSDNKGLRMHVMREQRPNGVRSPRAR